MNEQPEDVELLEHLYQENTELMDKITQLKEVLYNHVPSSNNFNHFTLEEINKRLSEEEKDVTKLKNTLETLKKKSIEFNDAVYEIQKEIENELQPKLESEIELTEKFIKDVISKKGDILKTKDNNLLDIFKNIQRERAEIDKLQEEYQKIIRLIVFHQKLVKKNQENEYEDDECFDVTGQLLAKMCNAKFPSLA